MLEIRLLGQFELRVDGVVRTLSSRSAQSLLAYLLLHAGTPQRRERLAGLLWPDSAEESARRNLRTALWHLRRVLADGKSGADEYIRADGITIAFHTGSEYWLDTDVLASGADGECTSARLIEAVAVYAGELLPGFYDDWAVRERERMEALFEASMGRLLSQLLAEERWDDVVVWSRHWLARAGYGGEPACRALMVAQACLGDLARAAETFRRCQAALREELGVEPSPQTVALHAAITSGKGTPRELAVALAAAPACAASEAGDRAPAEGDPPFLGLHHFEEKDAALFFGREALVARLIARLADDPALLVLVGASGSGKSSAARAGLVPAVRAGRLRLGERAALHWHVQVITPTARPCEALAVALTQDAASVKATTDLVDALARDARGLSLAVQRLYTGRNERLLLVVDQFEELFTLCQDEAERRSFVENLVTAAHAGIPLTVVLVLRADFYAHCAAYAGLREALASHQEYIGPMDTGELRRVVEGPAEQGGWDFEAGLVDLIVRDAGDEPGSLPLVSHALLETWRRRKGRRLTLAGYTEAGGVQGAIARTAERVYHGLPVEDQGLVRSIFLRLTALGEGTQDTRRRVDTAELIPTPELEVRVHKVVGALADARLVTLGGDTAEVAHEALIREWPALRRWLAEDREGLRLHRRLTVAAREWEALARDPSLLYRGTLLAQAAEWAETHGEELNASEREFLAAARALASDEAAAREAQRQRELEASRQLAQAESKRAETERRAGDRVRSVARYLAAALVAAILLAAVAVFFGYEAQSQAAAATAAREQAEQQRRLATARELAAAAVTSLEGDPERSILLAMEAVNATYLADGSWTGEAKTALHQALARSRILRTLQADNASPIWGMNYSPDGQRLATASDDGKVIVWDVATGEPLVTMAAHERSTEYVAFSPDGTRIASSGGVGDSTIRLWDAESGRLLQSLTGSESLAGRLAFHPAGHTLGIAGDDGTTTLWDLESGRLLHTLVSQNRGFVGIAFSPDGKLVAAGSGDNAARIWDVATGAEQVVLRGHSDLVGAVNFSRDGTRVVTAANDSIAKVWDASTGREIVAFEEHTNLIGTAMFSPDGNHVLTGSLDGTIRVWEVASGRELFRLAGHEKIIMDAEFSPDGSQIASVSVDGTARIWSVPPPAELPVLVVETNDAYVLAVSRDGTRVASADRDGTVRVWDVSTGEVVVVLPPIRTGSPTFSAAFSADGRRLATSGQELEAWVWDLQSRERVLTLVGHAGPVMHDEWRFMGIQDITYSPDGRHIATAGADATVRIWDASSGEQLRVLEGPPSRLNSVSFSADGQRLATGADDYGVRIWDSATGELLATLEGHNGRVWTAEFSPDGRWLASSSFDVSAKIWDLATGQERFTLAGHTATLTGLAISPDGSRLATVADTTARVWDPMTGRELTTIHGERPRDVAFSPDGTRLITAEDDGIHFYALQIEELMQLAAARVTRGLTDGECRKYLHQNGCSPAQ